VSRLSAVDSYKGIDVTIEALPAVARTAPEVTYRVVGGGDDEPRLRKLAEDSGVADRVQFAGVVGHERLTEEYRACELFVLPSKGEGFGLALLEAMAFSKPVVASAVGGPLDVVEDGVSGVLVADDADLPTVLADLLADPQRAAAMGERGRERAAEEFGFDRYAARWSNLLTGAGEPRSVSEPCAA
jgi:glycosyltransferase involved in cell wall biosynthesis